MFDGDFEQTDIFFEGPFYEISLPATGRKRSLTIRTDPKDLEGYKPLMNADKDESDPLLDGANKSIVEAPEANLLYGEGPVGKALYIEYCLGDIQR